MRVWSVTSGTSLIVWICFRPTWWMWRVAPALMVQSMGANRLKWAWSECGNKFCQQRMLSCNIALSQPWPLVAAVARPGVHLCCSSVLSATSQEFLWISWMWLFQLSGCHARSKRTRKTGQWMMCIGCTSAASVRVSFGKSWRQERSMGEEVRWQ